MADRYEVYKCNVCGNIVEIEHGGKGQLVCCNQPMKRMVENTVDAAYEKHVPVVEKANGKVTVKVGSVEHPMEEKHYIEWIEVIVDNKLFGEQLIYRKYLKPRDKPEAVFNIADGNIIVREYCNLHGLWKA
ncbi:Desulfoferrodoxin [Sporotomaculum syntrophicum]|uniref:Desulfoferrodoxin n=1 Tax=Sporotomaculum syntrophicum TaxID=182264 RepID=A0A9D2WP65_9FIRM|nr:desulfoferrodoxin [Sporotomaculum syntrophicum]KAF1084381.1 Desulfoferrodoxin [Sporotomaculum syntrophicum]